jgi:hypothetical protein
LETTVNGTGILNLTVTDTDFDTILDFGILSGNTKNVFAFNLLTDNLADASRTQYRATGQLTVVGPLSYEITPNYTLVLFAFDTQNLASITVTVNLIPENTRAPIFDLMPGFTSYQYVVNENTAISALTGPPVSVQSKTNEQSFVHSRSLAVRFRLDSCDRSRYSADITSLFDFQ